MFAMAQSKLPPCWLNPHVRVMGGALMACDRTAPKLSISFSDVIETCPKSSDLFIHHKKHIIFNCQ